MPRSWWTSLRGDIVPRKSHPFLCRESELATIELDRPTVTSKFNPPSIDCLAEVDVADCEYSESVIEIEGVVSPQSQGAVHRKDYHVHMFEFAAWRRPGQPLIEQELTIFRPVDPAGNWVSEYPKLNICRIRVLMSLDQTRAIFAGVSEEETDQNQLVTIAEELSKPVVVSTERLGEFALDRSNNSFSGKFHSTLFDKPIGVMIYEELDVEFVESCVTLFNGLTDDSINHLCRASELYCNDFLESVGEPEIIFQNPRSVLEIVYPSMLIVPTANSTREPVVQMELNCDWEEEHGMEWVIRENQILYVGAYGGCDPYGDFKAQNDWNYAWQTKSGS